MKTRLLSAAVSAALLLASGAALAQVPIANVYHSGQQSHYVAVVLQPSGGPHVIFGDHYYTWEWDPFTPSSWVIEPSTYHKRMDGVSRYAIVDGAAAWDFVSQSWTPLFTPGNWGAGGHPTAYNELMLWPEQLTSGSDWGLSMYSMTGGSLGHHLAGNGRYEYLPSLYQMRVAYEYQSGGTRRVAIHDLQSNLELYNVPGGRPDLFGSRIAFETNGGDIEWKDLSSGAGGVITPPAGCSQVLWPLFGGGGTWLAYSAACGGSSELWLRDLNSGNDQFIDTNRDPEFVHVVDEWLVYTDAAQEAVLIQFGTGPVGVQPLPVDAVIHSGLKGLMPTLGYDYGLSDPHIALFFDPNAGETWRWEPVIGVDGPTGNKKLICDGGNGLFACSDDVAAYYPSLPGWSGIDAGHYATTDGIGVSVAWEERNVSSDRAIAWHDLWSGSTTYFMANNGRDEERPVTMGLRIAYQVKNGSYDVEVLDVYTGSIWVAPDSGDETNPDLLYHHVAWEGTGHATGLAWWNATAGTEHTVPTPGTCAYYQRPRLGYSGKWVVYEGVGCASGGSELYLADMRCGGVYYVDTVQPLIDVPSYAMWNDKLVYANGNDEIIYVDVDENMVCGGVGPQVPTISTHRANQHAAHIAVSDMNPEIVIFSDAKDSWHWEPPSAAAPTLVENLPIQGLDGLDHFSIGEHRGEILLYDPMSWKSLAKGFNPTIYGPLAAWEDPNVSWDVAISGMNVMTGASMTVLDSNGLDERDPSLFGDMIAYEVDLGGNWDIGIHHLTANSPIAWVPDKGQERNPDLWERFVAFDLDRKEIVRYNWQSGSYEVAKRPTGCAGVEEPLLGASGSLVVFTALDCQSGNNELWLYSYDSGNLWYVDALGPLGDPTYHITEDRLAYIDASQEPVYLVLNLGAI